MQLLQIGFSSPHLILRLRQVRHPVFVLLRETLAVDAEPLTRRATLAGPSLAGSSVESILTDMFPRFDIRRY